MNFKKKISFAIAGVMLCSSAAFADYINLTTGGSASFGQVYFDAGTNLGTVGTGNIDSFVRLDGKNNDVTEDGYNTGGRPLPFDENSSPQFTHDIQLSDLFIFVNPGNGIPGGSYYRFLLDINQLGAAPKLSLDSLRIYKSATGSINSPTFASMSLIWNMDTAGACGNTFGGATCENVAGQGNGALLDYSLNNGSGNGIDMILFIPTAVFNGVLQTDYLYLYSEFGAVGGDYAFNDGFEEWARDAEGPTDNPPPPPPVPEPTSIVMLGLGLVGIAAGKRLVGKNQ
jgi:hypothetical protein